MILISLYFLVALLATVIGALAGLGGGIIIKPVLDLVSPMSLATVGMLSTFTVFAMAITSLIRQIMYKTKINLRLGILLSSGAIIGGYLGSFLFNALLASVQNPNSIKLLQNVLLVFLLAFALFYMNRLQGKYSCNLKNPALIIIAGLFLGTSSSFLGIGGGPINLAVLCFFFGMDTKLAAANSILLIFFSQLSTIITAALSGGFGAYDLTPLIVMVPAGVIGGLIGSHLNKKLDKEKIMVVFNITLVFIIGISIFNAVRAV